MFKVEIGVVVPTYNSGKTLEWTLLSLSGQEGCYTKVIVVDSGSYDETIEICRRHKVHNEFDLPGNMYRAINAGMRLLNTEWVTYLNSDDIVYRDSYSRLIAIGNRTGADVVYGHSDYIDWNGRFMFSFKAPHPLLLMGIIHTGLLPFAQPAAIFRKVIYEDLKGFTEKYRSIADFDFFARAILTGKKIERLSFPSVTAFRIHPNQFSRRERDIVQTETSLFFKGFKTHNKLLGGLSLNIWRFLNAKHYVIRMLRNGQFRSHAIM